MKSLATINMLAFYGLAVCTIGGTLTSGFTFSFAFTAAILEVTIGMIITREILRSAGTGPKYQRYTDNA